MMADDRRIRVYARTTPTDMRKSFDTLAAIVTQEMGRDPLSGDMFLFVNARQRSAKILFWDGTGLCLFHKRIEQARFAAPWKRSTDGTVTMTRSELQLFVEGSQIVFVGQLSPNTVEPRRVATTALVVR